MEKINSSNISNITKENLQGKIIVFPTDTVYGVGTLYGDKEGTEKIYQMKKRDYGKPLPVLCADIEDVKKIAVVDETSDELKKYFSLWPGALTIILKAKEYSETVAVRIPDSLVAKKVLKHFGPLSTTSVNVSGDKELNDITIISEKFKDYIDYLVIDDCKFSAVPSTIIDCTTKNVKIIRQGNIIIK